MRLSDAERFFLVNDLPRLLAPFARHRAQKVCSSELVHAWQCRSPSGGSYAFDAVSMPGRLLFSGDIGDVLLKGFSGWGHLWLAGLRTQLEVDYFAEKIATWPAERIRPELLLPWLGWHLAAAATFRRLLGEESSSPRTTP